MVSAPYFIATKLEAFTGRGGGDYLMSHDMEDLVAVLDGRSALVEEVQSADELLREFLATAFNRLLDDRRFIEALPGFLPADTASQARLPLIVERLKVLAGRK